MKRLFIVLCLAPVAGLAVAQEQPAAEKPTIAYGETHPDCLEWADGCIVCRRVEDGAPACSTAGVACIPAAVACAKKR